MRTTNTTGTATTAVAIAAKNVALFLLAPFIGLVYAVLLPFVGIAMLLWTAVDALAVTLAGAEIWNAMKVGPHYEAV